jgi:hypothetical protein
MDAPETPEAVWEIEGEWRIEPLLAGTLAVGAPWLVLGAFHVEPRMAGTLAWSGASRGDGASRTMTGPSVYGPGLAAGRLRSAPGSIRGRRSAPSLPRSAMEPVGRDRGTFPRLAALRSLHSPKLIRKLAPLNF